jgi:hypothetical protein
VSEEHIFPFTPRYPVPRRVLSGIVEHTADSGRTARRLKRAPRLMHELTLELTTEERQQFLEWAAQHRKDFFSFRDPVWGADEETGEPIERYFSVEFAGPYQYTHRAHNFYEVQLALVDKVGAALYQYPDPGAGHKSEFQEESEGYIVAGAWSDAAQALAHGEPARERTNANTNATDRWRWVYAGYGFRVWARKGPDLGIFAVHLDGGTGLANVDLYAVAAEASQPVFTKLDVPLGLHTVDLRATNTKNAASSAKTIVADALESVI